MTGRIEDGAGIAPLETLGGIISAANKEVKTGDEVEDVFKDAVEVIVVVYRLNRIQVHCDYSLKTMRLIRGENG